MAGHHRRLAQVFAASLSIVSLAAWSLAADRPKGLHLPQGRRVSFTHQLNDGAGFRWDIQYYGTVGSGTNSAFSGGMYCRVNGTNIRSRGYGWMSKSGDEIEIGPYSRSNLNCYRRIKVYRDRGLARWLDIIENPTAQNITVQVRFYTNRNYTVRGSTTSTGRGAFGPKDWAMVTASSGSRAPAVLHVFCGKHSKVRPSVAVSGNTINAQYGALTIPAGKTVVLCNFMAQGHGADKLIKQMRSFRAHRVLRDLSPDVRKLIVNFAGEGFDGVHLDRAKGNDCVFLKSGDPIYGTITNERFTVQASFGEIELPADQVVGMAAAEGPAAQTRFVLIDGQVISGTAGGAKLSVTLPAGGGLNIPLGDIRQWSYRISEARPEQKGFAGPFVLLRTGDRLAFEPHDLQMHFRTRHGRLDLDPAALLEISLDNRGNAVHRAVFRNGSRLGGLLEPQRLTLKLKLGRELELARSRIVRMRFAEEAKRDPALTGVLLTNEDELYGRVLADEIRLVTRYNPIPLTPENIKSIRRDGQTVIEMWNGTVHKGRLAQARIPFEIVPGPKLAIHTEQFVQILRPRPLPPADTRRLVEKLVAQLGAESYKDRQEATEKLMKLKGIGPLLRKYLTHSDPEVRQRVEEVLEKGESGGKPTPPRPAMQRANVEVLKHQW